MTENVGLSIIGFVVLLAILALFGVMLPGGLVTLSVLAAAGVIAWYG
jgi:hypothetical protein